MLFTISRRGKKHPGAPTLTVAQGTDSVPDPVSADIGIGLVARNLGDMRAFINLTDFMRALLPACGPGMFKSWAYLMTLELVAASGQRPLLSGFYRMLTVTMRLTSATGILQLTGQQHKMLNTFVVMCRTARSVAWRFWHCCSDVFLVCAESPSIRWCVMTESGVLVTQSSHKALH